MWAIALDKILEHMRCVDSRFPIQQKAPFRETKTSYLYQVSCRGVLQTVMFQEKTATKVKPIGRDRFGWPLLSVTPELEFKRSRCDRTAALGDREKQVRGLRWVPIPGWWNQQAYQCLGQATEASKERASAVMRTRHVSCLPEEARSSLIWAWVVKRLWGAARL